MRLEVDKSSHRFPVGQDAVDTNLTRFKRPNSDPFAFRSIGEMNLRKPTIDALPRLYTFNGNEPAAEAILSQCQKAKGHLCWGRHAALLRPRGVAAIGRTVEAALQWQ